MTERDYRQEPPPDRAAVLSSMPHGPAPGGFRQWITELGMVKYVVIGGSAAAAVAIGAWAATSSGEAVPGTVGQPTIPASVVSASSPLLRTARVTITVLGENTFAGTDAKGRSVTVTYGGATRFGNKARPFTAAQLAVGMTVTVLGERSGGSITATAVALPVKAKQPTPSAPPASP